MLQNFIKVSTRATFFKNYLAPNKSGPHPPVWPQPKIQARMDVQKSRVTNPWIDFKIGANLSHFFPYVRPCLFVGILETKCAAKQCCFVSLSESSLESSLGSCFKKPLSWGYFFMRIFRTKMNGTPSKGNVLIVSCKFSLGIFDV